MKKSPLFGTVILAVILLILGSLINVIGYQTIQSSKQEVMDNMVDQKDLLFQTIVDITNNKDIQRIILKSKICGKELFNSGVKFSIFNTPVLTKNHLKHMYAVGVMLSKFISKSKMHSMVEQYKLTNQDLQKEIIAVVENDATLKGKITQLSNSGCNCESDIIENWFFPVICTVLFPLFVLIMILWGLSHFSLFDILLSVIISVGAILNCFWI
ncbi:MAG: hypothetical protein BV458_04035 [Thermoplasmata archaeon M9B2D]|nr:MAG: hypothetical protein BV458_04035 [Thermoplasmata archaeon M9B2D]